MATTTCDQVKEFAADRFLQNFPWLGVNNINIMESECGYMYWPYSDPKHCNCDVYTDGEIHCGRHGKTTKGFSYVLILDRNENNIISDITLLTAGQVDLNSIHVLDGNCLALLA